MESYQEFSERINLPVAVSRAIGHEFSLRDPAVEKMRNDYIRIYANYPKHHRYKMVSRENEWLETFKESIFEKWHSRIFERLDEKFKQSITQYIRSGRSINLHHFIDCDEINDLRESIKNLPYRITGAIDIDAYERMKLDAMKRNKLI